MTEELELKLANEFAFMKRSKDEADCNIYSQRGCQCSDGWYQLIYDLCKAIADRYAQDNETIDIVVEQVKEKFAALRFYYSYEDAPCPIQAFDALGGESSIRFSPQDNNADERKKKLRSDIAQIVSDYESKSQYICECCGDSGIIRMDLAWKRTLCDDCYKKCVKENEEKKQKLNDYFKSLKDKK